MKTNLLIIKKKTLSCFMFYFINVTFQVTFEQNCGRFYSKTKSSQNRHKTKSKVYQKHTQQLRSP